MHIAHTRTQINNVDTLIFRDITIWRIVGMGVGVILTNVDMWNSPNDVGVGH